MLQCPNARRQARFIEMEDGVVSVVMTGKHSELMRALRRKYLRWHDEMGGCRQDVHSFVRHDEGNDIFRFSNLPPTYQDELLLLHCFHETLVNGSLLLGVICTSRRIFRNILLARVGHRHRGIPGATDGTYRLAANNWSLISFECYGVFYNSSGGCSRRVHSFVYLFERYETEFAYNQHFQWSKRGVMLFFRYALRLQLWSMDHGDSIADAYKVHWPNVGLLSCWLHLARYLPRRNTCLLIQPITVWPSRIKFTTYTQPEAHLSFEP
ncbi:hypothetical protein P3T76_008303 [Phytophthora citrophthora]|uniref:Uncharacterized protein n=1 Tax=Phytophthora citrophthora TaxID=4793 RepID=A0AAD9LKN4_9STRA|nr:hypothetical protein P3T76_008295 [Phytophthora citrophthora]KAK1939980.1 hypothetical protein P3T76_008303 [Phytophthora citrophthora]